jgi:ubiquinone/menaquinone biosynthesis C-methylase UbiE
MVQCSEDYVTDSEYASYFSRLNHLRRTVIQDIPFRHDMHVLDLAAGYGFFTIEVAQHDPTLTVTGIDISQEGVREAQENIKKKKLSDRVDIREMDATALDFPDEHFDLVVNFFGLEDIYMTRGRAGIQKTFSEVSRVLKPQCNFCFVVMPADTAETEAQNLEIALFSYICHATGLNTGEYKSMLARARFTLTSEKNYYTQKKLTAVQARKEIQYACEHVPRIYGITTVSFDDVWERFGRDIEKHGLGHYSKSVLMIAHKDSGEHR